MNIDLDSTVFKIKSETNNTVNTKYESYNYEFTDPALDLKNSGIIENTDTKVHVYKIYSNKNLQCKIIFMEFINENVSYISDLWVNENIRNKGIGSDIRKNIVNYLKPTSIYSVPTNEPIKKILRNQGFIPVEDTSLKKWYVKKY